MITEKVAATLAGRTQDSKFDGEAILVLYKLASINAITNTISILTYMFFSAVSEMGKVLQHQQQ